MATSRFAPVSEKGELAATQIVNAAHAVHKQTVRYMSLSASW
jgi:hypothetical protein